VDFITIWLAQSQINDQKQLIQHDQLHSVDTHADEDVELRVKEDFMASMASDQ
jgi:hypothetical protein